MRACQSRRPELATWKTQRSSLWSLRSRRAERSSLADGRFLSSTERMSIGPFDRPTVATPPRGKGMVTAWVSAARAAAETKKIARRRVRRLLYGMGVLLRVRMRTAYQLRWRPLPPHPAGRRFAEAWPSATAGADVRRGETPRAPPLPGGEGVGPSTVDCRLLTVDCYFPLTRSMLPLLLVRIILQRPFPILPETPSPDRVPVV